MLEDYVTRVYGPDASESLVIFLGVFMYYKDLEANLSMFTSSNFTASIIQELVDQVHENLFKYSHQKFNEMWRNQDFKRVFTHFDLLGSQEYKQDNEYAAGIEIINSLLQ